MQHTHLARIALVLAFLIPIGCKAEVSPERTEGDPQQSTPKESAQGTQPETPAEPMSNPTEPKPQELQTATLGAGCYWCIEAVLLQIDGVEKVASGFMGGEDPNATYSQVCSGTTGHAEVVEVTFDPAVLPYEELLDWFFRLHDPTTLNRQGGDRGTQYRSVIFYHDEEQKSQAETAKRETEATGYYKAPIVTEISPVSLFIEGPKDHQDYYSQNSSQDYCQAVIAPKLRKLGLED